jgi:alpha-glucoside transport system permease protein
VDISDPSATPATAGDADPAPAAGVAPAVGTAVLAPEAPAAGARHGKPPRAPGEARWVASLFLIPALILLVAIVLYPLVYSVVRSLFSDGPAGKVGSFIGLRNYGNIFTDTSSFESLKNNIIWVIFVPTIVTILGLIFAVLSERIRWATVFKTVLFMPMAISMVASGVTFSLIYADQPSRGLANAVTVGIHNAFSTQSQYPDEHPLNTTVLTGSPSSGFTTVKSYAPGTPALLPLVGLSLTSPPKGLVPAAAPSGGTGLQGVVWNDFKLGGGGTIGQIDPGELGLSGLTVQAVQNGKVVASTSTNAKGDFDFTGLPSGSYQLKLPGSNFGQPYNGISWLGPTKITPVGPNLITVSIIIAYLWIYAGFAMVLLAAGMAAIPRDALEAARVDGATEWQVFRRVTAPLLAPVLLVVFVTLVINVLKVFDIVFVISQSAGANGKYANVLATKLYTDYGNQQYGLASAIGVFLVLLVLPAMAFNIRRFRREQR